MVQKTQYLVVVEIINDVILCMQSKVCQYNDSINAWSFGEFQSLNYVGVVYCYANTHAKGPDWKVCKMCAEGCFVYKILHTCIFEHFCTPSTVSRQKNARLDFPYILVFLDFPYILVFLDFPYILERSLFTHIV